MTHMTALWLPILLSSVFVFIVSSIIHMASPWHKTDYPKMPNEEAVMDALRPLAIPPGDYFFPKPASMADMKSEEFKAKRARGPVVMMTVMPSGQVGMGRELVLWFLFSVVVSIFAAYICAHALLPGAPYRAVFRFAGLTSFIGYSVALWPMSIWYRRAWTTTIKGTVDALIYGGLTAGTFGWLWPR
jgi:hypothetical protein